MVVTVIARGPDGWGLRFPTVTISDRCPVCCGPRGVPTPRNFCEDGDWYNVDCWDNPCGHVDQYPDVLREADLLARAAAINPTA